MRTIAVIPEGHGVGENFARFSQIVHAVQIQLIRDFNPAWHIDAAIAAYPSVTAASGCGYYVFVKRDAGGAAGMHFCSKKTDEAPHAIVQYSDDESWSKLLSHEVLEMLIDPSCILMHNGVDPQNPTGRADFLIEVCDPCMDNSYYIDEAGGIEVSDFCLPAYYGMERGSKFTFCDSIDAPLTVASGGYLTWKNSQGVWWQFNARAGPCEFQRVNPVDVAEAVNCGNLRGTLDRLQRVHEPSPLQEVARKTRGEAVLQHQQALEVKHAVRKDAINLALQRLGP